MSVRWKAVFWTSVILWTFIFILFLMTGLLFGIASGVMWLLAVKVSAQTMVFYCIAMVLGFFLAYQSLAWVGTIYRELMMLQDRRKYW